MFPKRDLIKDLISETSGNFKNILVALMMTPDEFDAYSLHIAMKVKAALFIFFFSSIHFSFF
jgi:hypothetical protein